MTLAKVSGLDAFLVQVMLETPGIPRGEDTRVRCLASRGAGRGVVPARRKTRGDWQATSVVGPGTEEERGRGWHAPSSVVRFWDSQMASAWRTSDPRRRWIVGNGDLPPSPTRHTSQLRTVNRASVPRFQVT